MTRLKKNAGALGVAALLLAACGSSGQEDQATIAGQLRKVAAPAISRATGQQAEEAAPAAPLSADEMAARALACLTVRPNTTPSRLSS